MKRSTITKTSIILFSLLFFVSSLSLLTLSQTTTTSFSETIVYTTPQSISNHVYYLSLTIKGEVVTNKTSVRSNVTSISSNISALALPPLHLNGFPITPPQAIGDNIYFVYVPRVTSISNLSSLILNKYNSTYLACANYTNGSWHVKNVITSGIVTGISVYNDSLYAIWKQSPTGEAHLLVISQNHIVRNVSVNVPNASSIEVGNGVGVVSNVSPLSFNLQMLISFEINVEYFVINLTTGKVIYKIPDYNGISPVQVSVSNGLGLVSYVPPLIFYSRSSPGYSSSSSITSYIVLYNLSTGKIISPVKSFNGIALGYINDKFMLVYYAPTSETSPVDIFTVYNLSWGQLYQSAEPITPQSVYMTDGLFVNSTTVTILLTQLSMSINTQTNQVMMTSALEFVNALQVPKPFTINVSEQHYHGYTTLDISWNENQSSTYLVYVNNTLVGQTKSEFIQYNVTENGTYFIKVVAENPLGEVQENTTVKVIVYPVQTTSTSTTTTSTTTTTTSTTTFTTSSSSTTTTSTTTTSTTSSTTRAVTSSYSTVSSSTATTSHSTTSFSTALVIAIVVIVVIVVGLAVFLARRK